MSTASATTPSSPAAPVDCVSRVSRSPSSETDQIERTCRPPSTPVVTNATDRLRSDLDELGLAAEVDVVISSWELKVHKPAPEFFAQACRLIGTQPDQVLFVDDDDRVIRGARAAGLSAYRWTGPHHVDLLKKVLDL